MRHALDSTCELYGPGATTCPEAYFMHNRWLQRAGGCRSTHMEQHRSTEGSYSSHTEQALLHEVQL